MSAWFLLDVMWIPKTERCSGYITVFAWNKWMSSSLCNIISLTLFSHQISGRQSLWEICRLNLFRSWNHDSLQLRHFIRWKPLKIIFCSGELWRVGVRGFACFNSHVLRWKKVICFCCLLYLLEFLFRS